MTLGEHLRREHSAENVELNAEIIANIIAPLKGISIKDDEELREMLLDEISDAITIIKRISGIAYLLDESDHYTQNIIEELYSGIQAIEQRYK